MRFTVGMFLVLICKDFEEPVSSEGQVVLLSAQWRQVSFIVLHEGSVTRIDGFDGVNTPSARLEEKLSLEHKEDVSVTVLLGALFVAGLGG